MICIYCENIYEMDTIVCPVCNEYKGMMTTEDASKEYDFLEYLKG
jgi:RNA polymerase subunit RPABC4/transcription elongation factor Spt4